MHIAVRLGAKVPQRVLTDAGYNVGFSLVVDHMWNAARGKLLHPTIIFAVPDEHNSAGCSGEVEAFSVARARSEVCRGSRVKEHAKAEPA